MKSATVKVPYFAVFPISRGRLEACLTKTADESTIVFKTKYQERGTPQTANYSQVNISGDAQFLEDGMPSTLPDKQE